MRKWVWKCTVNIHMIDYYQDFKSSPSFDGPVTLIAINLMLGWPRSRPWDRDLGASGLFGPWSQEALLGELGSKTEKERKSIWVGIIKQVPDAVGNSHAMLMRASVRRQRTHLWGEEAKVLLQFPSVFRALVTHTSDLPQSMLSMFQQSERALRQSHRCLQ